MSDMQPRTIGWHDLTVPDAERIRDFYASVVGWKPEPVPMGEYADFNMTSDGTPIAGVCHARGENADMPAQWIFYVVVTDLDACIASAVELGGEAVVGPKSMGEARYAVIRDPAGALCGLYQP